MKTKYYVTTAIAYPNSTPHLGHALEIIQADVVARFNRLLGKEVVFQTGTDEHGTKNWETAQKEGKEIKSFLDHNVAIFKDLYKKLDISYDYFIRTSDKKVHYPGAKKLWSELVKAGDIYKKNYKGLYCSGCEAYKTEKELEDGKCPNHPTKEINVFEEENYFFKLSKYKGEVIKKIKKDEYKVVPDKRKNEILSFLKEAKDISFSRPKSSLPWGIPVPDDDEHVMYVWCDALSNYITGVGYGTDDKKFKEVWPADVHIIGKDILRFHAAFWPAMLLSAKVKLPKDLFVHGFVLTSGAKMSKSTGNVIEPFEQIEKFGVDQFRFNILDSMPYGSDGDYSEELVVERVNTELVGNLSNFCYRALNFCNKNFDSKLGKVDKSDVIKKIETKINDVKKAYEKYDFKKAIDEILSISDLGNKYFQSSEPWKLIKEDKEKARSVITTSVNIIKNLVVMLKPIIPGFAEAIEKQLNLKDLGWRDINFKLENHKINKSEIIVRKVEKIDVKEESEFSKLNIKVAKVLDIKDHPDADKLYVMNIDLGKEKRQLVAGLRDFYDKKEIDGKKICVLTNLEYAKLRGIESQGMLLAGDDGKNVGLLFADKSKPGDQIFIDGVEKFSDKKISFKEFLEIKGLEVKNKKPTFKSSVLKTEQEEIKVEKSKDGARIR